MRNSTATPRSLPAWTLLLALAAALAPAHAARFTVDTAIDAPDGSPGDGACDTGAGACSLRAAVQEANALAGEDEIGLPAGTYTLTLTGFNEDAAATGDLDLLESVKIRGAGRDVTILDGNAIDRLFDLCPSGSCGVETRAQVSDLTIRNGNTLLYEEGGAALLSRGTLIVERCLLTANTVQAGSGGSSGGAIVSFGDLEVHETDLVGNSAFGAGAIFLGASGGGGRGLLVDSHVEGNTMAGGSGAIRAAFNTELTILRSTISGNVAAGTGGGMRIEGDVRLINSTVSGNQAGSAYGGLMVEDDAASLTIVHSTIADNASPGCSGVCVDYGEASVSFAASIVTGNDCIHYDGAFSSLGRNVENGDTCNFDRPTDRVDTDPLLGPLAGNGGFAPTHALLPGSPAIDAVDPADCPEADQRGQPRLAGCGPCDIGAYETGTSLAPTFTVTKIADSDDGVCNADCSLREALAEAEAAPGLDVIDLPAGNYTLTLGSLAVGDELQLVGSGSEATVIDAAGNSRVLSVGSPAPPAPAAEVLLCDVSLTGGLAVDGAGIYLLGGRLTLLRTTIRGNTASDAGGALTSGILISPGGSVSSTVTLLDSVVEDNTALRGGGIWHDGGAPLTLQRSTVRGNRATAGPGGGLWGGGGGVLRESTFTGNVVDDDLGGGMALAGGDWKLTHMTFTGNRADANGLNVGSAFGGAIAVLGGTLDLHSSTVAGNKAQAVRDGIYFAAGLPANTTSFANSILDPCSGAGTGGASFSLGYNLVSGGCVAAPQPTDSFADPLLEPLADNGGPTKTRALATGSPAIDGGNPAGCTTPGGGLLTSDQRGSLRGARCDIGAFELDRRAAGLQVVRLGNGSGRVIGAQSGIDCGATCLATALGPVALEALPDPGSCFSGWGGDTGCLDGTPLVEGNDVTCTAGFVTAPSTTLIVNSTVDAGDAWPGDGVCEIAAGSGVCTLRAAIDEANRCGGALEILLPAGSYTLTLDGRGEDGNAGGDLDIRGPVQIVGAGAGSTVIDANRIDRAIDICPVGSCDPSTQVELHHLTVRNGEVAGLVDPEAAGGNACCGGNILNLATTTLSDCTVADGFQDAQQHFAPGDAVDAFGEAGGIATFDGSLSLVRTLLAGNRARAAAAVITNSQSALTLIDSTVTDNEAVAGTGGISSKKRTIIFGSTIHGNRAGEEFGGLRLNSPTDLVNSTVSGNFAPREAGITFDAPLNVINSTIAGNTADPGACGGICGDAAIDFHDSILAGNGKNCVLDPGAVTSRGYNIEDADDCGLDQIGDQVNTDPLLAPLGDNGGPTWTHALTAGSPAIDAGDPAGCVDELGLPLDTDQRGRPRPIEGNADSVALCDAGAFEYSPDVPPVPDGGPGGGLPLLAALSTDGTSLDLSWDVATCGAGDHNVMIGPLVPGSPLVVDQAVCGVGSSGTTSFATPMGSVAFVVVSTDGNGFEGSHGFDSQGLPRPSDGIGVCGITAQSTEGTCSP